MNHKWTLHVEDFGKIKEADIEISPLMLFVGDNNSGKSYLMSLLFGLFTVGMEMFIRTVVMERNIKKSENYIMFASWAKKLMDEEIFDCPFNVQQAIIDIFNAFLDEKKELLIQKIFNGSISVGKIEIRDCKYRDDLSDFCLIIKKVESKDYKKNVGNSFEGSLCYLCKKLLMNDISSEKFFFDLSNKNEGEPVFLPATRTGFILTYKTLIGESIEMKFGDDIKQQRNPLTLPATCFLKDLSKFDIDKDSNNYCLAEFIENKMLIGTVNIDETPVPNISYKPIGVEEDLPLHLVSTMVTEMAPLVLYLKSSMKFKCIIIEEPEISLHPQAQLLMARVIIKLINSGISVWITTHSDTILQHINNMIKLGNNKRKIELLKNYEYDDSDILKTDDVKMYQFEVENDNKSKITALEHGEYGFIAPTFNKTLVDLLKQSREFEEEYINV